MIPVPSRLLIHTVTHGYSRTKTAWKVESGLSRTISRVRVEPSSKIIRGKDNTEKQLTATMFYCCTNSSPVGVTFMVGDTVTLNDSVYRVEVAEPMYDEGKLHHWELGLM